MVWLVVVGLTVVGVAAELRGSAAEHPSDAGAWVLVGLAALAVAPRRRYPEAAAAGVLLASAGYHAAGYPGLAVAVPCFAVAYALAAYRRGIRALVGATLVIALTWLIPTVPPDPQPWLSAAVVGPLLGIASAAVVGLAARQRQDALDEQLRAAHRAAAAETAQRLAEERLRIARELHDVLAHTVSVIAVQAGVALDVLDTEPAAAREALHQVRTAARQAGPHLRALLTPLRPALAPGEDGVGAGPAPPQPGLDQLDGLLEVARAAGLRVALVAPAGLTALPDAVQLTAYRVVQEALTNVIRHAAATRIEVELTIGPTPSPDPWRPADREALSVRVRDDGIGPGAVPAGLGLTGMRERAELLGGSLRVGPATPRGFEVRATLPVLTR